MLRATFCHLTGIGPISENALWRAGCRDWADLRAGRGPAGLSEERRRIWLSELDRSEEAIQLRDPGFFARRLPSGEQWRIAPEFAREIAYLDIETTGLSPYEGIVTVVAVHGGGATRSFVADDDLEERLGVIRPGELKGVDGLEAVRLWHAHRAGRPGALERLVQYNRADTVNLEPLLEYAARELTRRTYPGAPAGSPNDLSRFL